MTEGRPMSAPIPAAERPQIHPLPDLAFAHTSERLHRRRPTCECHVRVWRPLPLAVADVLCLTKWAHAIAPHAYEQLAVTLALSYGFVRWSSRQPLSIAPGDVLIVPRCEVMAVTTVPAEPVRLQTILVGARHLDGLTGLADHIRIRSRPLSDELSVLFDELRRSVHAIECIDWLRAIVASAVEYPRPLDVARTTCATPLAPVRDYLRRRVAEPVSLPMLVRYSGLSEFHLVRAFRREFGLPPHAYQVSQRLAHAASLLSLGARVSSVAFECGFADQSHLSRKFKETYGVTPAAWARSTSVLDTILAGPAIAPETGADGDCSDVRVAS